MKRLYVILFFSLFCFCNVLADELCDNFLAEGKQLYNSGNYQKAKEHFDYVKTKCGVYYGDVTNWINKCDAALTPTLSVSKSQISCSASGTTQYVTVTSNTAWEVQYPSSSMYSVTRNGNTLTVKIYSTTSTETRTDFFNVKTIDGRLVEKIALKQTGKVSNSLEVSTSLISCSANATTQYVTVTSNTTWEVQHPTGNMYSVTRSGNTLTVKITANTSTNSREAYFIVRTSDGVINKKITLKQSGKTSSSASYSSSSSYLTSKGKIHQVWAEHNVMYGGQKCMKIHVKFEVEGMKGKSGDCVAWFYYSNGNKLYDTNNLYKSADGQVAVSNDFNATYENSLWNDFVIYIPNSELHIYKEGSYKFCVGVFDHTNKQLATSSYVTFTYGNSSVKKSNSYRNSSNLTAYQKYIQNQDNIEITWVGLNTSLCTGYEFGFSLFRFRFGWFQLKPYEMNVGYDFVRGGTYFAYNPSINFLIPTGSYGTLYFGGGPSFNTSYYDWLWFNTELGYRWHWGDWASSDFFMRYDGAFTVGLSIQWSSYF